MTFFYSVIAGIVSGLLSSILIFVFWQLQKPKLEISKEIAKNTKGEFRVKIVNKTKRYILDVNMILQVVKRTNGPNGDVYNTYNLVLPYSGFFSISPRKKPNKSTDYAIRFVLPNDLEKYWNEDDYTSLKLTVHCSNEYGTAKRTFVQHYLRKSFIKDGEFECGDSMKIVRES